MHHPCASYVNCGGKTRHYIGREQEREAKLNQKVNRQWVLKKRPKGAVSLSDFEHRETEIPEPGPGEILVRNTLIEFAPGMRQLINEHFPFMPVSVGQPMNALTAGVVVKSRSDKFAEGDLVRGLGGWRDFAVLGGPKDPMPALKIPANSTPALALGLLGETGLTAYFGMLEIGRPQAGESVAISSAAGAVGSVAGQIAKIKGCTVIGIAGGPEKKTWLTEFAGFDAAIDYKSEDVGARLGEIAPKGLNLFFDNVGGEILSTALGHLAMRGRIVVCGAIASYDSPGTASRGLSDTMQLVGRRARIEGFVTADYSDRTEPALAELSAWHAEGKLRTAEDVRKGFENIPATFLDLLRGRHLGKLLLEI